MARRYYNGTVRDFNIAIQSFPDVLMARTAGFRGGSTSSRSTMAQAALPSVSFQGSAIMIARIVSGRLVRCSPRSRRPGRRNASSASSATSTCSATAISWSPSRSRSGPRAARSSAASCATFPTTYRRADGSRVEVGFDVQSVTRDGQPETFATERMANGVRVRIGRGDRTVNRGLHQYVIRYRTTRQIGFFDDFDELYWNATGTGWTFPIDVAEARINAAGARRRSCRPRSTPGRRARAARTPRWSSSSPAGSCSAPPGRCRSPTGSPSPPPGRRAWWRSRRGGSSCEAMLQDDPALLIAAAGRRPRDRLSTCWPGFWSAAIRRAAPSFRCSRPPEGMSAAAVRFVDEMGFDDRVFTAAIVGLGVNGHLRLIDRGGEQGGPSPQGQPADRCGGAGGRNHAVCQAIHGVARQLRARADRRGPPRAAPGAAAAPISASCSATISGWSSFGLLAAVLVIAAIALSYVDSYGSRRARHPGRPVPAAHSGHGRRRHDAQGLAAAAAVECRASSSACVVAIVAVAIGIAILSLQHRPRPAILPALVPSVLAGVRRARLFLAAGADRGGPRGHGPDRRLQAVPQRRRGGPAGISQPAGEDAGTVRALPALRDRARRREHLGQALHRRAGRGRRRRRGVVLVQRRFQHCDERSSPSPTGSATTCRSTIASAATPPGSTGGDGDGGSSGSSGGGSSGGGGGGGGGSGWYGSGLLNPHALRLPRPHCRAAAALSAIARAHLHRRGGIARYTAAQRRRARHQPLCDRAAELLRHRQFGDA